MAAYFLMNIPEDLLVTGLYIYTFLIAQDLTCYLHSFSCSRMMKSKEEDMCQSDGSVAHSKRRGLAATLASALQSYHSMQHALFQCTLSTHLPILSLHHQRTNFFHKSGVRLKFTRRRHYRKSRQREDPCARASAESSRAWPQPPGSLSVELFQNREVPRNLPICRNESCSCPDADSDPHCSTIYWKAAAAMRSHFGAAPCRHISFEAAATRQARPPAVVQPVPRPKRKIFGGKAPSLFPGVSSASASRRING